MSSSFAIVVGLTVSAVPSKLIMYQDNTQNITLNGLQPSSGGLIFENNATMSGTLVDQYSNPIPGCTNVIMSNVVGSNGTYVGAVGPSFSPDVGGGYRLIVDADTAYAHLHLEIPVEIQPRSS